MRIVTVSKRFTFEASHVLPKHPGKCSRLHGHSWGLTVSVRGPIDEETGFVVDYGELKDLVETNVIKLLDHTHLGYSYSGPEENRQLQCAFGPKFYPSSENLVFAIVRMLQPLVQEMKHGVVLQEVAIEETCTSRAVWSRDEERGAWGTHVG